VETRRSQIRSIGSRSPHAGPGPWHCGRRADPWRDSRVGSHAAARERRPCRHGTGWGGSQQPRGVGSCKTHV